MAENKSRTETRRPKGPDTDTDTHKKWLQKTLKAASELILKSVSKSDDERTIKYYILDRPIIHRYRILMELVAHDDNRLVWAFDTQKNLLFRGERDSQSQEAVINVRYLPSMKLMGVVSDGRIVVQDRDSTKQRHLNFKRKDIYGKRSGERFERYLYWRKKDKETSLVDHSVGVKINLLPDTHSSAERILIVMYALRLFCRRFKYDELDVPTALPKDMPPISLLPADYPLSYSTWETINFVVTPRCAFGNRLYSDILDAKSRVIMLVIEYDKEEGTGKLYNQCGALQLLYTSHNYVNDKYNKYNNNSDPDFLVISTAGGCRIGRYYLKDDVIGESSNELFKIRTNDEFNMTRHIYRKTGDKAATVSKRRGGRPRLAIEGRCTVNERALFLVVLCLKSATYYRNVHEGLPHAVPIFRQQKGEAEYNSERQYKFRYNTTE